MNACRGEEGARRRCPVGEPATARGPWAWLALGLLAGCPADGPASKPDAGPPSARAGLEGWPGALLEDPSGAARAMRSAPDAWRALLEGDLVAAEAAFRRAPGSVARVGLARALLERARLFDELGWLVAETQARYLALRARLLEDEGRDVRGALRRAERLAGAPAELSGMQGWLARRARGERAAPPCPADGALGAWVCTPASRTASAAAAWVGAARSVTTERGTALELYEPVRWWAAAEALRGAAARALPPKAPSGLREALCRGREDGPCAGGSNPAAPELVWAARFARPTPDLQPREVELLAPAEVVGQRAEATRAAVSAAIEGPAARAARAAGLPHLGPDAALRRAARARLARGAPGDCPEALDLLQRSRDHRRPDAIGRRNRPGLFARLARAASCAGRHAEALGAARTLAARHPEAEPAARLAQRVAAAAIVRRGATGDQKTNR